MYPNCQVIRFIHEHVLKGIAFGKMFLNNKIDSIHTKKELLKFLSLHPPFPLFFSNWSLELINKNMSTVNVSELWGRDGRGHFYTA